MKISVLLTTIKTQWASITLSMMILSLLVNAIKDSVYNMVVKPLWSLITKPVRLLFKKIWGQKKTPEQPASKGSVSSTGSTKSRTKKQRKGKVTILWVFKGEWDNVDETEHTTQDDKEIPTK